MAHGGARPCPGTAGPALVVASTSEHLHVMEKTKRELRKEEGSGAVLATVRSPAWPWRPWRGGARSRQYRSPRVRTAQRRRRRDSWDASGALSEMERGESWWRACASSAEQLATAVVRCGRCGRRKRRQEARKQNVALGGSRARAAACAGALWPDMA